MAQSTDTKVNEFIINATTEELLKTQTIQPNQIYVTPDDISSGSGGVANYVDLSSSQTITGQKTFTQELIKSQSSGYAGYVISNTGYTRGNIPTNTIGLGRWIVRDSGNQYLSYLQTQVNSNGSVVTELLSRQATTAGGSTYQEASIGLNTSRTDSFVYVRGRLQPHTNNTYDLGTEDFRWRNAYLQKIDTHTLTVQNAEINGTPAYGVLSGTSAPTTTTVGAVGQFYLDTTNKQLYQCMSISQTTIDEIDTNVYAWKLINDKGTVVNINNVKQSTLNFDSDPQTQIDNIANNTTLIQNSNGGFAGGEGASVTSPVGDGGGGGAIGYFASSTSGGAIGYDAIATLGGAVGNQAHVTYGGAVGGFATTSFGFAGGWEAKTLDSGNVAIDAIQLGTGTNSQEKTLQIYDDNIYNASTHTLTVQNFSLNGAPIIESGSNANGYYIKFADGTLICWGEWFTKQSTILSHTFVYPYPFISNTAYLSVSVTPVSVTSNGFSGSVNNLSSTSLDANYYGVTSRDVGVGLKYIAIGRWK